MIYEHTNYQTYLRDYVDSQKSIGNSITYQGIADSIRVQKSYFSKVMGGNASLNLDQGFLLSKTLKLDEEEKAYLFLLIQYERASLKELKDDLGAKIDHIRNSKLQTNKYINRDDLSLSHSELQQYYLYPETQLIHIALSIPKIQKEPKSLITLLGISDSFFNELLSLLEKLHLIKIQKNKIIVLKSGLHIPPDSPFHHQWNTQFKLKGIEQLKRVSTNEKYNFNASFSATEKDMEEIKLEFLKLLKKIEKIVKKAEPKKLYQLHFDLFKWL